jgi:hypothetical protein
MKIDQDIQSYKMRYLPDCVYWICLFKSIKDNRNKNTNEIDWRWTYKKYYLKINIFYFKK